MECVNFHLRQNRSEEHLCTNVKASFALCKRINEALQNTHLPEPHPNRGETVSENQNSVQIVPSETFLQCSQGVKDQRNDRERKSIVSLQNCRTTINFLHKISCQQNKNTAEASGILLASDIHEQYRLAKQTQHGKKNLWTKCEQPVGSEPPSSSLTLTREVLCSLLWRRVLFSKVGGGASLRQKNCDVPRFAVLTCPDEQVQEGFRRVWNPEAKIPHSGQVCCSFCCSQLTKQSKNKDFFLTWLLGSLNWGLEAAVNRRTDGMKFEDFRASRTKIENVLTLVSQANHRSFSFLQTALCGNNKSWFQSKGNLWRWNSCWIWSKKLCVNLEFLKEVSFSYLWWKKYKIR